MSLRHHSHNVLPHLFLRIHRLLHHLPLHHLLLLLRPIRRRRHHLFKTRVFFPCLPTRQVWLKHGSMQSTKHVFVHEFDSLNNCKTRKPNNITSTKNTIASRVVLILSIIIIFRSSSSSHMNKCYHHAQSQPPLHRNVVRVPASQLITRTTTTTRLLHYITRNPTARVTAATINWRCLVNIVMR